MTTGPSQAMNLGSSPGPYSDAFISLDLMKGAESWRFYGTDGEVAVDPSLVALDSRGWLTALPTNNGETLSAYANVFYTTLMPAGKFILEWEGEGEIGTFTDSIQIGKNKLLIDYRPDYVGEDGLPQYDGITVYLSAMSATNPIHDIKLYKPENADLLAAGEHFNPLWMDRIDDFRMLRLHDAIKTNFPTSVDWTTLSETADQATWGDDGRGLPYELIVEIANQSRADLWINIPHTASDQFIRKAAAYVHANLDAGLQVMVEFSNEYWTTIFDQYDYFAQGGQSAYGNAGFAAGQFYGSRAAHMADIFAAEFGAESPVLRPVVTVDDAMFQTGEAERMLRSPAEVRAGGTPTYTHGFEVIATDGYLSWWGPDPNTAAMIRDWMTDADGGFGRARDFLIDQLYSTLLPNWQAGRALADKYGLDFMVYEGGTLLLNGDGTANPDLTDFALRFSQSQELRAVYEAEIAAWATVGTGAFAWYSDVGRGGFWGDYGHWKGPDFIPDPRTGALVDANANLPPWWQGDDRPSGTFDNGIYAAGTQRADQMHGGALADRLFGLSGADNLAGGAQNDRLWAGTGADTIRGGAGADEINGGAGRDLLAGGTGADQFVYQMARDGGDTVEGFGAADRFVFLRAGFQAPEGPLAEAAFQSSNIAQAENAEIRVIYDRNDHRLYYDKDGNGDAAAVLIAVLQPGAVVEAGDIWFQ